MDVSEVWRAGLRHRHGRHRLSPVWQTLFGLCRGVVGVTETTVVRALGLVSARNLVAEFVVVVICCNMLQSKGKR